VPVASPLDLLLDSLRRSADRTIAKWASALLDRGERAGTVTVDPSSKEKGELRRNRAKRGAQTPPPRSTTGECELK
jgi:hypothetical protein